MEAGGINMEQGTIKMEHGSGGKLSKALMEEVILPAYGNPVLNEMHDGASVSTAGNKVAFTTDSYVVKPLFFAGGNIGKLAVCGTVNDLAMTGSVPRYLSVGMILEEGFPIADLRRIVETMCQTAKEAGVMIVTGDTKVVNKGAGDGIYINTAGIGDIIEGTNISPKRVQPGQDVILSGYIGDHATAIMAGRHELVLPTSIQSDCAPLNGLVKEMLTAVPQIAVLRDPTRGGVAATLNEIAEQSGTGILLEEDTIPVRPEVDAVCEILGFDPLYLANEGKLLAFVDAKYSGKLLEIMHKHEFGKDARIIGKVTADAVGQVGMRTSIGGIRIVDMPIGGQIPRIC
ncbi:MAG: hypE [Firmicutes bacterium]|nr:hypE [Bacillota bacterium]